MNRPRVGGLVSCLRVVQAGDTVKRPLCILVLLANVGARLRIDTLATVRGVIERLYDCAPSGRRTSPYYLLVHVAGVISSRSMTLPNGSCTLRTSGIPIARAYLKAVLFSQ